MRALAATLLLCVGVTAADEPSTAKSRARELFKSGEAAYQAGNYDRAIHDYNEAFALVPLPLLLFDLGQAYRMKGERDKAIANYQKYLDVDPNGRGAEEARTHLDEFQAQIEKEKVAKRAADESRKQAAEAKRKADEEARLRAAEEAKRRDEEAAKLERLRDEQHQRDVEAAAVRKREADAEYARRPAWKKPWFWAAVGGAVVVVGVAVGVGAAFGSSDKNPSVTWGHIQAN
jgi:tetratricopeptide (TPR) repeat protein